MTRLTANEALNRLQGNELLRRAMDVNGDGYINMSDMTKVINAGNSGDRVHPTLVGHRLYANSLCGKLL